MAQLGFKPWDIARLTKGQLEQYHRYIVDRLNAAAGDEDATA